jgi:hypothetical protein
MKDVSYLLIVSLSLNLFTCKSNDPEPAPPVTPIELKANAGTDQTGAAMLQSTLNGSASTGPVGFTYEWTYLDTTPAESELSFQNKTSAQASFTPTINGIYNFKLRVTSGINTSEDDVKVTVSGARGISGNLGANFTFSNIESDPTKPDYKITSDLILDGSSTMAEGVVLEFAENTGIEIKNGVHDFSDATFTSATNWKGILLTSGVMTLDHAKIENAGVGLFTGQTESAALTNIGTILYLSNTEFVNSTGFDFLTRVVFEGMKIEGNTFSSKKPIKAPFSSLHKVAANTYPENYDYITLTTSLPSTSSYEFPFRFPPMRFYIVGDFICGIGIRIGPGTNIWMEEGKGIFSSGGMTIKGTAENPVIIDGLDGAPWKGIANHIFDTDSISHVILRNAGSEKFDFDEYHADVAAAISCLNPTYIQNVSIEKSHGYGIYIAPSGSGYQIQPIKNTFIESTMPALRVDYNRLHAVLPVDNGNTFEIPDNVAGVEIIDHGGSTVFGVQSTWPALPGGHFYLATTDIVMFPSGITLSPGVILKFKSGKSLRTPIPQNGSYFPGLNLYAIGTAEKHIIFDSEEGTPGTWNGMRLDQAYKLDYCEIRNGGQGLIEGATEKANVIFNFSYGGSDNVFYYSNSHSTGSAGYGAAIETGVSDPGVNNVNYHNTFSNNVSGNFIRK